MAARGSRAAIPAICVASGGTEMTDDREPGLRCKADALLSALSTAALWIAGIGLVADDRHSSPGRCSAATC